MNTQPGQKQKQGQGERVHNGDKIGVQTGDVNFYGDNKQDDFWKGIQQQGMAIGGDTLNRFP